MNSKQKKRLFTILLILFMLALASILILYALKQNINLFYTPTQLTAAKVHSQQTLRIGGYVKQGSVHYSASGQAVRFVVTDHTSDIQVNYQGVLPNLFREGQGVVISGQLNDTHIFVASQVLAKHDEKYMPWPLTKALGKKHAT